MRIAVVDGQGGGIGKTIIEKLRQNFGNGLQIVAFGTNALAASLMLKAGANEGASGENAIVVNMPKYDVIMGAIGIITTNSMLGELTSKMAAAVCESPALKILIPLNNCNIQISGTTTEPLPHYIDDAMILLKRYMEDEKNVRI